MSDTIALLDTILATINEKCVKFDDETNTVICVIPTLGVRKYPLDTNIYPKFKKLYKLSLIQVSTSGGITRLSRNDDTITIFCHKTHIDGDDRIQLGVYPKPKLVEFCDRHGVSINDMAARILELKIPYLSQADRPGDEQLEDLLTFTSIY